MSSSIIAREANNVTPITVGELIEKLANLPKDLKITIFSVQEMISGHYYINEIHTDEKKGRLIFGTANPTSKRVNNQYIEMNSAFATQMDNGSGWHVGNECGPSDDQYAESGDEDEE